MIAEVVAVGTELLLGQTVNTNCAYLGARLADLGYDAHYQVVVGDNLERITNALRTALARSDAVIITGGLGPTPDDITREAICQATGREMEYDLQYEEELIARWEKIGRSLTPNNLRQAQFPSGAQLLPNARGTAPGLFLEDSGKAIVALPGVPAELYSLFEDHVIPRLSEASGAEGVLMSRVLRTWGLGESAVSMLLDDIFHAGTNPSMAYLASAGEVKIRLSAKAPDPEQARALIKPLEAQVRERMGSRVFAVDSQTVEGIILEELSRRSWKIGTAESMTSGMVAASLSSLPGSSSVFQGGIVAYHPQLKTEMLGVAPEVMERHGIVSVETALEMASGAAQALSVEAAAAVTGSSGPEPLEHAAGTAAIAVLTPEGAQGRMLTMPGDRERVRAFTTTSVLHHIRLAITGQWWKG